MHRTPHQTMPHGFFYIVGTTLRDALLEAKLGAAIAAILATVLTGLQQAPETWAEAWARLAEVNMVALAGWLTIMALSFVVRLFYLWANPGKTTLTDYSEHFIEWSARIIFWGLLAIVLLVVSHIAREMSAAATWIELFGFLIGASAEGISLILLYVGPRNDGFARWMLRSAKRFFSISERSRKAWRRGVDGAVSDAARIDYDDEDENAA